MIDGPVHPIVQADGRSTCSPRDALLSPNLTHHSGLFWVGPDGVQSHQGREDADSSVRTVASTGLGDRAEVMGHADTQHMVLEAVFQGLNTTDGEQ